MPAVRCVERERERNAITTKTGRKLGRKEETEEVFY